LALLTDGLHARQLVLQNGFAVDQQAANQCAFAVVYAAAGDKAQGGSCVLFACDFVDNSAH
jgi:hypothetical protein